MNTRMLLDRGLKIVSGGQKGADCAALDWAIANQVSHGGWCPKGRKAEDGIIARRYNLTETHHLSIGSGLNEMSVTLIS